MLSIFTFSVDRIWHEIWCRTSLSSGAYLKFRSLKIMEPRAGQSLGGLVSVSAGGSGSRSQYSITRSTEVIYERKTNEVKHSFWTWMKEDWSWCRHPFVSRQSWNIWKLFLSQNEVHGLFYKMKHAFWTGMKKIQSKCSLKSKQLQQIWKMK